MAVRAEFYGFSIQAHLDGDAVRLFAKHGFDRTDSLRRRRSRARTFRSIRDPHGEAVILDHESVSDAFALHAAMARGRTTTAAELFMMLDVC